MIRIIWCAPPKAGAVTVQAPWISSVDELLELHAEACRHHGTGAAIRDVADGWAQRVTLQSIDEFVAANLVAKIMRETDGGVLKLTWRGAFMATYSLLPPGIWLLRRRTHARAHALLRNMPARRLEPTSAR